jgi:cadmium resistance protein CadD (predicted permease)
MPSLVATVTTASALFVGTNFDDIVVLAVLNIAARSQGHPAPWQIWVGQFAGIAFLVGAAVLGAFGLTILPDHRTWLLGLVPLGLGLYKLAGALRNRSSTEETRAATAGVGGVLALTVANGGDNIAAYTPVFRSSAPKDIAVMCAVFVPLVAIWCVAGSWLGSRRRVIQAVGRWGHWILPPVFIAIGLYVFEKGGLFGR